MLSTFEITLRHHLIREESFDGVTLISIKLLYDLPFHMSSLYWRTQRDSGKKSNSSVT